MSSSVANGTVTLATGDLGGTGTELVLMHGLGASRRSLAKVVRQLAGWRVITMDLRGHGQSSTAAWTFANAVADLDAVITHYGLTSPYVGGHSLGGMVALQYALAGRPVAGVINIDGWGPGIATRYLGEDPDVVAVQLAEIATGHLPSRLARWASALSRQSREGTTAQVLTTLHGADVVAWHRDAGCRSLAVHAVAPSGRLHRRVVGEEMDRLQAAHRAGLRRDLTRLGQTNPEVMVVEVNARHALIRTHPDDVAAAIQAFHATTHERTVT